jgi:hypothetical protein
MHIMCLHDWGPSDGTKWMATDVEELDDAVPDGLGDGLGDGFGDGFGDMETLSSPEY